MDKQIRSAMIKAKLEIAACLLIVMLTVLAQIMLSRIFAVDGSEVEEALSQANIFEARIENEIESLNQSKRELLKIIDKIDADKNASQLHEMDKK